MPCRPFLASLLLVAAGALPPAAGIAAPIGPTPWFIAQASHSSIFGGIGGPTEVNEGATPQSASVSGVNLGDLRAADANASGATGALKVRASTANAQASAAVDYWDTLTFTTPGLSGRGIARIHLAYDEPDLSIFGVAAASAFFYGGVYEIDNGERGKILFGFSNSYSVSDRPVYSYPIFWAYDRGAWQRVEDFEGRIVFTVPFTPGVPLFISLRAGADASGEVATADFSQSLYWGGIDYVSVGGVESADFTATSGSGADLRRSYVPTGGDGNGVTPVPLPATAPLLALGLLAVGATARRTRR